MIQEYAKYESGSIDRDVMHKFQVLLRVEVHWLLESKEKKQEYEDGGAHDADGALLPSGSSWKRNQQPLIMFDSVNYSGKWRPFVDRLLT